MSTADLPARVPLITESDGHLRSTTRQFGPIGPVSARPISAVGPLGPESANFGCPPGCWSIRVKPCQRLACRAQQRDGRGKRKLKNVAPECPPPMPGRFLRGAPGIGAWGIGTAISPPKITHPQPRTGCSARSHGERKQPALDPETL